MQDCGRLCANETVAAVVSASASVTASFVTKDDVMAHLRGSGGRRAGCPTRRVPLGKLHQRADRKSAACSPSMPPAPPRVREETHRPDELIRARHDLVVSARAPGLAALSWSSIFQCDRERIGERNVSTAEGRCRLNEQAALFAAVVGPLAAVPLRARRGAAGNIRAGRSRHGMERQQT
jgi:hypothetical protein